MNLSRFNSPPLGANGLAWFGFDTPRLAAGLFIGAGLGTVWGEQKALAMLREAGFTRVDVLRLAEDPLNNYYVARKA